MAGILVFFLAIFIVRPSDDHDLPQKGVDLAESRHARRAPGTKRGNALGLNLTRNGEIFLGNDRNSRKDSTSLLQAGARNGSEQKIYLRVRARAKYGDAKAVLHQIRTTGIESAALLSQDTRHETAP